MFIRKKQNKSGSTSIHIVRKEGRQQVHLLSIGTATNEGELIELEQIARDKLSSLQSQIKLDFKYAEDEAFAKNLQSIFTVTTKLYRESTSNGRIYFGRHISEHIK